MRGFMENQEKALFSVVQPEETPAKLFHFWAYLSGMLSDSVFQCSP